MNWEQFAKDANDHMVWKAGEVEEEKVEEEECGEDDDSDLETNEA